MCYSSTTEWKLEGMTKILIFSDISCNSNKWELAVVLPGRRKSRAHFAEPISGRHFLYSDVSNSPLSLAQVWPVQNLLHHPHHHQVGLPVRGVKGPVPAARLQQALRDVLAQDPGWWLDLRQRLSTLCQFYVNNVNIKSFKLIHLSGVFLAELWYLLYCHFTLIPTLHTWSRLILNIHTPSQTCALTLIHVEHKELLRKIKGDGKTFLLNGSTVCSVHHFDGHGVALRILIVVGGV